MVVTLGPTQFSHDVLTGFVHALADADFTGGGDRVRYVAEVPRATGPFTIEVSLVYQPIGYRWAQNLSARRSMESERFVGYYQAAASASAVVLASASQRHE